MQKNLYQVLQSTVKYRFSFRTLSDRNMKMGCHAIFFLQRLNLVPRGYINLDRTNSFHGISGEITETFSLRKILSPRKLDEKVRILRCERMETIIHFRKNMMAQPPFYYLSLIMKVLWSRIYYKIEGNYFEGKIWVFYKLKNKGQW